MNATSQRLRTASDQFHELLGRIREIAATLGPAPDMAYPEIEKAAVACWQAREALATAAWRLEHPVSTPQQIEEMQAELAREFGVRS